MANVFKLTIALVLMTGAVTSRAEHNAQWIKFDRIQMGAAENGVTLVEHAGWQFASCPNARHAILDRGDGTNNFDAMYSLVMMAYQSRDGIIIHGDCHPNNSDMVIITHLFIQDRLDD